MTKKEECKTQKTMSNRLSQVVPPSSKRVVASSRVAVKRTTKTARILLVAARVTPKKVKNRLQTSKPNQIIIIIRRPQITKPIHLLLRKIALLETTTSHPSMGVIIIPTTTTPPPAYLLPSSKITTKVRIQSLLQQILQKKNRRVNMPNNGQITTTILARVAVLFSSRHHQLPQPSSKA